MFRVNHFDPQVVQGKRTESKKKRPRDGSHQPQSSLRVIAPDQASDRKAKKTTARDEEAFDDMDIVEVDGVNDSAVANDLVTADTSRLSQEEIQTAIQISQMPIEEAAKAWRIAPFLIDNLKKDGFQSFFPIQALTIPDVIANERHPHIQARDICVTAPTGSGKTLSYVLPILNSLANRQFRRLRALVVLPSRDLADQVYRVFLKYTEGSNLKVGLAVGQSDFKAEQVSLTVNTASNTAASMRQRLFFDPGNLDLALKAFASPRDFDLSTAKPNTTTSPIDILVCTPGRLVEHLESTPGFTLHHLRFVCIDEADRLLNQSYLNWFDRVLASVYSTPNEEREKNYGSYGEDPFPMRPDQLGYEITPITWRRRADDSKSLLEKTATKTRPTPKGCQPVQLRKFLVSATLTRDPQKLASLQLINPRHFDLHQMTTDNQRDSKKYAMPKGLEEFTVTCAAEQKPIVLLSVILESLEGTRVEAEGDSSKAIVVVFTSSIDSTHRLARLLQLLWIAAGLGHVSAIAEFSSSLNQRERTRLIQRCNDPKDHLSIVICSDGMSRGMDIQLVSTVINYDVPIYASVYVHRCGRTARAGKKGTSITLLKGGQAGQFRRLRSLIQSPDMVQEKGIRKQLVSDVVPHFSACANALQRVLEAEADGAFKATEIDPLMGYLGNDEIASDT